MRVLVIPDVHLKPELFERAGNILEEGLADRAVCLMDIADDWGKQYNEELYIRTYDAAIAFAKKFPDSLWCYGNHDLSYLWEFYESGYSSVMRSIVVGKLMELNMALPVDNPISFVHRIDKCLFSHGGVSASFVDRYVRPSLHDDVDETIQAINSLRDYYMWKDDSPIWLRPQEGSERLYKEEDYLQVVGHTPMEEITKTRNLISCDVFSTYRNGVPIGTEEFLIVDTETFEYNGIKGTEKDLMEDQFHLARFMRAQDQDFESALKEIRAGRKRTHWIWYIFPQLKGLGESMISNYYGIDGRAEALAYMDNPVLKRRLLLITEALLALEASDPVKVMGKPDDKKLQASMTLFATVCPEEEVFRKVLDQYFEGKMHEETLVLLGE